MYTREKREGRTGTGIDQKRSLDARGVVEFEPKVERMAWMMGGSQTCELDSRQSRSWGSDLLSLQHRVEKLRHKPSRLRETRGTSVTNSLAVLREQTSDFREALVECLTLQALDPISIVSSNVRLSELGFGLYGCGVVHKLHDY